MSMRIIGIIFLSILLAGCGTMKGRVIDAETSLGIKGTTVKIMGEDDSQIALLTTDKEGNFAIPKGLDKKKRYNLLYYKESLSEKKTSPLDLQHGSEEGLILFLKIESAIKGKIVSSVDGSSISQATITLLAAEGSKPLMRRDSEMDGSFSFSPCKPDDYFLRVDAYGFFGVETRPFLIEKGREFITGDIRLEKIPIEDRGKMFDYKVIDINIGAGEPRRHEYH